MIFLLRCLFSFFVKSRIKEIKGLENIPVGQPFIAASNHISFLDPFYIGTVLFLKTKKVVYSFTYVEYWKYWERLKIRDFFGMIPASTMGVKTSVRLSKAGHPLIIFPEGKRNVEKNLLRAKKGVAELALFLKAPVIPIGFTGGPSSLKIIDSIKYALCFWKEIKLNIGRPIYLPEECLGRRLSREEAQRISDELMRKISELCRKPYPY